MFSHAMEYQRKFAAIMIIDPPFNGKDSHLLTKYFKYLGIEHQTNLSAEDPES